MSWKPFKSTVDSILSSASRGKKNRPACRPAVDALEERLVPTTYSTNFPLTESPISEGGHWINGGTTGIDWGNVNTTPGYAVGVSGPSGYADATALLTGTWGPDQSAQATVKVTGSVFNYPEVELRLRSTISAHVNSGYEITESVAGSGNNYLIIVRWNGALNDFTYLNVTNPGNYTGSYSVTTGDVVKATIVGDVISAYKNGVLIGQAVDNTYTSGNPGFGFNYGNNGSYGDSNFSATDSLTTVPGVPTALAALAANAQVSLTWNASAGATSYNIYRSTTSGGEVKIGSTTSTSFTDTGLTNGTRYFYEITAVNSAGESGKSSEVSATPQAVWTEVQTSAANTASASTAVTLASSTTAGDTIIVEVSWSTGPAFSSLTDNQGNTYVEIGTEQRSSSFGISSRLYYAKNIKGGPLTVTSLLSGTAAYHETYVHEYSGLDPNNPLDGFSVNVGSGSSFTSNNVTTTAANDLLYGIDIDSGSGTAASGWTPRSTFDGNVAADKNASTTGSYAFTGSSSGSFIAWEAAFKLAGTTTTNQPPTVATAASASPNTVTGTTTNLNVLGADDGGEANLTYIWATTGTPPAAVSFSANGSNASKNTTATFSKAGNYTFTVTIKDAAGLTTTSSVAVTVNQTLTSVVVSPASATLADGATQQFSATAKDQFGNVLATQPGFSWSVDRGGLGSISSGGLYTAPASGAGSATVRAAAGGVSSTASVTVTSQAKPWAAVQANANNTNTASTATTLKSSSGSGDLVIIEVSWSTGVGVSSVTDSQGNTYVQIGTEQQSASFGISSRLYYAKNIKGGPLTVTSVLSGAAAYHETYVFEYSGLDPNNPLDGFSVSVGSGSSFTSNGVKTTAANDLLFGMDIDSATGHAASGWTTRSTFDGNVAADENASTAGTYAFTGSSSGSFIAWAVAFKQTNPEILAGTPLVGSSAPGLSMQQLSPVIVEAIADWAATGLSAAQLSTLRQSQFVITDLPGGLLGDTVGNTIYIDTNAGGYGWSLGSHVSAHKVDLLTVVAHELGHELGLSDVNTQSNPGNVMDDTLGIGVRRLPSGSAGYAADASRLDIRWMGREWARKE